MRQQPSLPISSITEIPGLSQFSSCLYDPCPEDHLSLWWNVVSHWLLAKWLRTATTESQSTRRTHRGYPHKTARNQFFFVPLCLCGKKLHVDHHKGTKAQRHKGFGIRYAYSKIIYRLRGQLPACLIMGRFGEYC